MDQDGMVGEKKNLPSIFQTRMQRKKVMNQVRIPSSKNLFEVQCHLRILMYLLCLPGKTSFMFTCQNIIYVYLAKHHLWQTTKCVYSRINR